MPLALPVLEAKEVLVPASRRRVARAERLRALPTFRQALNRRVLALSSILLLGIVATLARNFGWAFAWWGIGLYWWAGVLYAWQVRTLLRETPRRTTHATDHG